MCCPRTTTTHTKTLKTSARTKKKHKKKKEIPWKALRELGPQLPTPACFPVLETRPMQRKKLCPSVRPSRVHPEYCHLRGWVGDPVEGAGSAWAWGPREAAGRGGVGVGQTRNFSERCASPLTHPAESSGHRSTEEQIHYNTNNAELESFSQFQGVLFNQWRMS